MVEDFPPDSWPVAGSEEEFKNWLITVRTDKVRMPDSSHAERTVVTHIGAVAILALDEQDRVLMIRQYRHPVAREWHALVDSYASPGIITERIRIFLARGLEAAESDYQREGEEKFLRTAWVPLAEAVQA